MFRPVTLGNQIGGWIRNKLANCAALDWTLVGAAHWEAYQLCINASIDVSGDDVTSTFGSLAGGYKWVGGVLAPNGCIYGIPLNSTTVLKIDPVAETVSTFGSLAGGYKWIGGVLAPNGCIYGIPYSATTVLKIDPASSAAFDTDVCLSAYFDKF